MYLFKPILHTRCKQGFKVGYSFLYLCLFMFYLLYAIKRTGRPRTSPIMLLSCQEIAEARRLPPPPHLNPPHVAHLSHSSTPKRTKKPPCAQQESQCARRLKERIARKGGLRNLSPLPIQFDYFIVTSLAVRTFVVSVPSGITASPPLTAKQARKGHANTPNPTPRPIARPFLFLPSREMLPPIKFTNVPSVARVETKATFRTPALPQPRRFVPVTCVCTGVPALIMIYRQL